MGGKNETDKLNSGKSFCFGVKFGGAKSTSFRFFFIALLCFRMVRVKKLANSVPTVDAVAKPAARNTFSKHARKLRPSITPGVIAIVLAGVHKVFFLLPGVSFRRFRQNYPYYIYVFET